MQKHDKKELLEKLSRIAGVSTESLAHVRGGLSRTGGGALPPITVM